MLLLTVISISVLLGLLGILWQTNLVFRYHARMGLFYLYLVAICILLLPVMLINGRSPKNLKLISRMMDPARGLFQISSEIRGYENMIQDRPCVIVSNHQTSLDVFGMAELYPENPSFMAKHSLKYLWPVGLALWLSGGIFVNRADHRSSRALVEHVSNELKDRKLQLWIFPEGTRGRKRGMLPFKKGAFNIAVMAQVPIVPVVFKRYDFYEKIIHKFQPGKYVAEVLPSISTDGLSYDDVESLSNDVRKLMLDVYCRLSGLSDSSIAD